MFSFLIFYYIFSFLFIFGTSLRDEKSPKETIFVCIFGFILFPIALGLIINEMNKNSQQLNGITSLKNEISYLSDNIEKVEHELIKDKLVREIIKELTKKYNYNDEK